MFRVVKSKFAISGKESQIELMEHKETGKIHFRDYYETTGFNYLEFHSYHDILVYLDTKFDCNDFVICHGSIFYPLSAGDRNLEYLGTILEIGE